MKGIEALKKHLGKPQKMILKNEDGTEDEIELDILPLDKYQDMMYLLGKLAVEGEEGISMSKIDKEAGEVMTDLILSTLKQSYPTVDEKDLKRFASTHYFELMTKIFEVNTPSTTPVTDTRVKKQIEDLKKKVKEKDRQSP